MKVLTTGKNLIYDIAIFEMCLAYPNKAIMEMHPKQFCWQGGIALDKVPSCILDNLLGTGTCISVEMFSKVACLTKP